MGGGLDWEESMYTSVVRTGLFLFDNYGFENEIICVACCNYVA